MLKTQPEGRRRAGAAGWCLVVLLTIFNACTAAWFILGSGGMGDAFHITTSCPPPPCLDALVVYHEDDHQMLIDNGGLESAMKHLVGVRNFFILSASNKTFRNYLELPDRRVRWIDETRAPFTRRNFEGARRPAGWLFQQALKLWTIAYIPELCNDVIVLDSDVLWLREFDVRAHPRNAAAGVGSSASHSAGQHHHTSSVALSITGGRRAAAGSAPSTPVVVPHCPPVQRYKYCLSSMDTGAWYGDITNPEYQHFVKWFLGMPKELADTHTGINNWQVMQRDVILAIEAGLQDRGLGNLQEALMSYSKKFNGMSEYEAYFSFVWARYRDRVEPVYLPWILRKPSTCNYNDKATMSLFHDKTSIMYFTCHDNYDSDDYYINCKGRERQCDPALAG